MEAINELEAERNQQRDEKQQVGQKSCWFCTGGGDIRIDAVRHIEQPTGKNQK
jgi:hypothetical protein